MANQTRDVELRIRATNFSRQTTDQVVAALKEMAKAQDAQIESAKKGTTTTAQLEASYQKLEGAARALLSQQSLTKLFEAQSKTLTEVQAKLEAARKAQQDYNNALTPGADRTKKEEAEIKRLARALQSVEKEFTRVQNRVDTTSGRLAEFGITSGNLAASQQKIIAAVTQANAALERQETAINNSDAFAAKRKRDAELLALRHQQVRADALFERAQRDVTAALEAQTRAQRENNQAAAMNRAAQDAELERIFTVEAQRFTDALNRKTAALQAQQNALRLAADQAERLLRASSVQSRGAGPVLNSNLTQQIRDIQSPADAAARSVRGIETAIAGLETRVTQIRGPVRDYRGALEEARRTQEALLKVAGQVDAYQRQIVALRAARAEYAASRVAVNGLITELRSGNAGADVTTRLAAAQRTLQSAAANLGQVTTAARAQREALRLAGVDTRNLTAAEAALVAQAGRATTALNALTAAFQRNGAAADRTGSLIADWFGGGRTTLSFMQRMRGELLGMAAGFIGLNAAVGLAKSSLDAYRTTSAIMSRLTIANGGDARKAAEDFQYLQAQADRIGFVFLKVAPAYTKFAIAMKSAGFNTQETRFAFENIAGAAVKAKLSTEELEGVMKAFEQIASKGKVQAEELRGQLGDRLPGAFQIAARAAGKTVQEYTKMMELGDVGSEQVIAIARELGKTYGIASAGAEDILVAQARFENAADRFKTSTAEGGFVQAYQAFLTRLTEMLNNGQADVLATQLSAGFVAVIDIMSLVADNIGIVTLAVKALIATTLIKWLFSLKAVFLAVKTEVIALNGMLLLLNTRLSIASITAALTAALGSMGIATAGLTGQIGLLAIALRGLALAVPVLGAAVAAYYATTAIVDGIDQSSRDSVKKTIEATTKAFKDAEKANADYRSAMGKPDEAKLKANYERARALAVEAQKRQDAAVAAARKNNLTDNGNEDIGKALGRQSKALAGQPGGTADPGDRPPDYLGKLREDLLAEDKKTAQAMKDQRLRSAKEELADRLGIIDEQFEARRKRAKDVIKDETQLATALKEINASSERAQAAERLKFQNEQQRKGKEGGDKRIRLAQEIKDKLAEIEDDIAKRNANADPTLPYVKREQARVDAIKHAYDEVNQKILRMAKNDPAQAAKDKTKLDFLTGQRVELERQNSKRDEANRLVDVYNAKQTILKDRLAEINGQFETNKITAEEMLTETNLAVASLSPEVQEAGQAALDFAQSVQAMLDPVAFQAIMAEVSAGIAKADTDATLAGNNLAAQQTALNLLLEQQARDLDVISQKRRLGMISSEEEAALVNQSMADYKTKINESTDALLALLKTAKDFGAISPQEFAKATAGVVALRTETNNAHAAFGDLVKTGVNSVVNNGVTAFEALAEEIAKVAAGAQSIGDGFRGALAAVGQFFAQLMRDIALAIVKQLILNAIMRMMPGGQVAGAAASLGGQLVNASAQHTGGITGRDSSFKRWVPREVFDNAPRYHTGGLAGFQPNEVPAILERNEEVLTRDDPRHVLNGGKQTGGGEGGAGNRFVLVDDRARVPEAMATSEGEKVTMVHLKKNLSTLKQWMR